MHINSTTSMNWKKFLEKVQVTKVHSRRYNPNNISIKETEFVVKKLSTKEHHSLMVSLRNSDKHLIMPIS